jgi:hypothetical protein
MNRSASTFPVLVLLALAVAPTACATQATDADPATAGAEAPLIGGHKLGPRDLKASCTIVLHWDAENVDGNGCGCALVAPNVALTAGHCVRHDGIYEAKKVLFADGTTANVVSSSIAPGFAFSTDTGHEIPAVPPPDRTDLALLKLSSSFVGLGGQPAKVSFAAPSSGMRVFAVGQVKEGTPYVDGRYKSDPFAIDSVDPTGEGKWVGAKHMVLEPGDSGGTLYDATTNEVVGVNSWGLYADACSGTPGATCSVWSSPSGAPDWYRTTLAGFLAPGSD